MSWGIKGENISIGYIYITRAGKVGKHSVVKRGVITMKRLLVAISIFVLSIAFTGNSMGASSIASIYVQAEAAVVCIIEGVALDLGTYTGSSLGLTSSFNVQCSDTTSYTISYDEGQNFLDGGRRLSDGGTNYLTYFLACESSSGVGVDQECGNGTTIGLESSDIGTGLVQPYTVEASVNPGQFVPTGTYWDDVYMTLTY